MSNRLPIDTSRYQISDIDNATNPHFYGFVRSDGAWYIMREDTSLNEYRYAIGAKLYADSWLGRGALTYTTFDQL